MTLGEAAEPQAREPHLDLNKLKQGGFLDRRALAEIGTNIMDVVDRIMFKPAAERTLQERQYVRIAADMTSRTVVWRLGQDPGLEYSESVGRDLGMMVEAVYPIASASTKEDVDRRITPGRKVELVPGIVHDANSSSEADFEKTGPALAALTNASLSTMWSIASVREGIQVDAYTEGNLMNLGLSHEQLLAAQQRAA